MKRAISRGLRHFLQTYDVICRWGIYFLIRISNETYALVTEEEMKDVKIRYAIPSMHIESHEELCRVVYGLKSMDSVGRVHGEGVEHMWGPIKKLRQQVREMGWGARRDFVNDHIRHWNWQKTLRLGEKLILMLIFSFTNCYLNTSPPRGCFA